MDFVCFIIMEVIILFFVIVNCLIVVVSDVFNLNIDDMFRGVGYFGYGGIQGDFLFQVGLYFE